MPAHCLGTCPAHACHFVPVVLFCWLSYLPCFRLPPWVPPTLFLLGWCLPVPWTATDLHACLPATMDSERKVLYFLAYLQTCSTLHMGCPIYYLFSSACTPLWCAIAPEEGGLPYHSFLPALIPAYLLPT